MKKKTNVSPMQFALVGVLAVMFLIFSLLNGPSFYSTYNIMNILKSAGCIAIMVLGLTWVVGSGEMDCSFPDR